MKKTGFSNLKWVLVLTMRGSTVGIDDNLQGTSKAHFIFLSVLDTILTSFVIGPAIVGYWRGTWCLMDVYIFPTNVEYTIISSTVIGLFGHLVFTISQNYLRDNFHPEKHRLLYYTVSRLYTYVYGIACVNLWRGAWKALDYYTGTDILTVVIPTVVSVVALAGMRTFRNISGAPFGLVLDVCHGYFEVPTMFRLAWVLVLTMRGSTAGIDDNLQGTSKAHFIFLSVLDTILSSIVIGPAVVGYWRGTWCLMDVYIFPTNIEYTIISSTVIGLVGHLVFTISQNYLRDNFHPEKHRLLYYTVSRLYTYVYGLACVNLWRGAWKALDYYTGTDILTVAIPTVVSVVALAGMRTFRSISGPPFGIVLDICQGYFEVPAMFRLAGAGETSLYILDCFFSVFVVGSLVVFVWRGAWVLTDCFCYPDDDNLSAIGSLIIGYAIVIVTFSLQTPMKRLCEKLTGFWRILVVDLYIGFSFIGTINLWRGIWNLLNLYFLPESPAMSCWITHLGCFVFLVLINCSNSVLVRGVYIDAEEEGGKCVVFPTYYLRFFIQERRKKKIQKNQKNHTIPSILSKEEFEKCEKISKELSVNHNDVKCHVTVDLPPESGS